MLKIQFFITGTNYIFKVY